jgi:kynureninase
MVNLKIILLKSPRQAGWWGHTLSTRFEMPSEFSPTPGAHGWQQSNPSMLSLATLQASLEIFDEAGGMEVLRGKSLQLTGYLDYLLRKSPFHMDTIGSKHKTGFKIITCEPSGRGCQLSLLIIGAKGTMECVFQGLRDRGVIGDERQPDVIRLAPTPLYNTFEDCFRCAEALDESFHSLQFVLK